MLTKQSKAGPESLEHEHHDSPACTLPHVHFEQEGLLFQSFCKTHVPKGTQSPHLQMSTIRPEKGRALCKVFSEPVAELGLEPLLKS